jgi:hypothetical protein
VSFDEFEDEWNERKEKVYQRQRLWRY